MVKLPDDLLDICSTCQMKFVRDLRLTAAGASQTHAEIATVVAEHYKRSKQEQQ